MDEANIFANFIEHNKCLSPKRVAVYGTGKYAHRFANEQDIISVVCYLDKSADDVSAQLAGWIRTVKNSKKRAFRLRALWRI